MYSPFYQLRKPVDQQNAIENVQQFPAHLVPGKLIYRYFCLTNQVSVAAEWTAHLSSDY
jgi:hypothetical protein